MTPPTKLRDRIQPGDLVQITDSNPKGVLGLVFKHAGSRLGQNYWHCIWANGMSSDHYAAESVLSIIAKGQ